MSFETFVTEELARINDTLSAIAENSKKIEDLPPYVGNLPSGGQVPFTSAGNTYKIDPKAVIDTAIEAQITDSTILNGVTTSSSVPSTGNIHAIGVGPGTYTNWGGMVIPANNIGTLQRVDGVYSVSLTAITLLTTANFQTRLTYALMIADGTPTIPTIYNVENDEDKSYERSTYLWKPDGNREWIATTTDN